MTIKRWKLLELRLRRLRLLALPFWLVTSGFEDCGVRGMEPDQGLVVRWWQYDLIRSSGVGEEPLHPEALLIDGKLDDSADIGGLALQPPGVANMGKLEVFSSETGLTYWVSSQAPSAGIRGDDVIGASTHLEQIQVFRKDTSDASLKLVVSSVFLEAIDADTNTPTFEECPWQGPERDTSRCGPTMTASVDIDVSGVALADGHEIFRTGGFAEILGWHSNWQGHAYTHHDATAPFWRSGDFDIDRDFDADGGNHAVGKLGDAQSSEQTPVTIDLPLASLAVGEQFSLVILLKAESINHRQHESYLSSYFRDPAGTDGLAMVVQGLTPVKTKAVKPVVPDPAPAAACPAGPDPSAGILQLAAPAFSAPEIVGDGATIVVTRTGGSRGAVSALLTTHDGTALAGADYQPVATQVLFADGESGERVVRVPILPDGLAEPGETLTLVLSDPAGCAALGPLTSAVVTILDDDSSPVSTPSGLDPSFGNAGLVTTDRFGGDHFGAARESMALQADGKIVMAGGYFADFQLARFDVDGSLDTSFGSGGKVVTSIPGSFMTANAQAVAIQPDGKIVVGGFVDIEARPIDDAYVLTLARYLGDGTLDPDFGSGGIAVSNVAGRGFALALQPDGKIVFAGESPIHGDLQTDFVVARFGSDGSLDGDFGTGGSTTTDFDGAFNGANAVAVLPSGAIVVGGTSIGQQRMDVARYSATGQLDDSFGSGGRVTLSTVTVGKGLALQGDGKLVIVGSAPDPSDPVNATDFAVTRLTAGGAPDDTFGTAGTVTTSITGERDAANAVVLDPAGRIVVAGQAGSLSDFAVARYGSDGSPDESFATGGTMTVRFAGASSAAESVALQADEKIVLGGFARASFGSYALARIIP